MKKFEAGSYVRFEPGCSRDNQVFYGKVLEEVSETEVLILWDDFRLSIMDIEEEYELRHYEPDEQEAKFLQALEGIYKEFGEEVFK